MRIVCRPLLSTRTRNTRMQTEQNTVVANAINLGLEENTVHDSGREGDSSGTHSLPAGATDQKTNFQEGDIAQDQKQVVSEGRASKSQERGFIDAVKECKDLECLTKAHKLPRQEGQFNFVHAFIVGWPKTATTSLYYYLKKQPSGLPSLRKVNSSQHRIWL